jgi:hypothetical protein
MNASTFVIFNEGMPFRPCARSTPACPKTAPPANIPRRVIIYPPREM